MKKSKIIIVLCLMTLLCSGLTACGATKTDSEVMGTEADAIIVDKESATYEERTDIFLINNNIYGEEYSDGSSIDMNSLNPKGGRVVTEREVNIYNQQKECIGYIKSGVTLTMATQSNEWSYVYVTDGGFIIRTEDIKDLTIIRGNQNNVETTESSQKVENPTYTDTATSKIMYAKENVNVRSGPSTDYGIVGSLNANDEVVVTGESGTGWYQIKYNNGNAYVSSDCLSDTKVATNSPSNNGGNTNENENNSGGEYVPPTNEDIYIEEPTPTPTPEPTYTYTTDEVIAIVRSTLENNGIMWYPNVFPNSEYGPSGGMGWGVDKVPMNDPYTYANGMIEGFEYWGFNMYYIEYQGIENGTVVLKTYWGTLPQ